MKELKKLLPKEDRERVTRQMERITNKRNRRIDHYLHAASKRIIDFLVEEGIGTVIIGKNPLWKQASFLDLDPIPDYTPNDEVQHVFSGKRLYRTKDGRKVCADMNGAYNILRKSRSDAFAKGIAGYVVHPVRLVV